MPKGVYKRPLGWGSWAGKYQRVKRWPLCKVDNTHGPSVKGRSGCRNCENYKQAPLASYRRPVYPENGMCALEETCQEQRLPRRGGCNLHEAMRRNKRPSQRNAVWRNKDRRAAIKKGNVVVPEELWTKYAGICQVCFLLIDLSLKWEYDDTLPSGRRVHPFSLSLGHVVPHVLGGPWIEDNMRPEHLVCNNRKPKPRKED